MKTHNQPIPLTRTTTESESRVVKTIALFTFRGLQAVIDAAKEVPGIVTQAATDVAEAWEESRAPKA